MRVAGVALACLVCFLGVTAGTALGAAGEKGTPPVEGKSADPSLAVLLDEVHQLRLALQRATVDNTRFQMAMERMRVQQGHVDMIRRDLGGIRSEISNLESSKETVNERLGDYEGRVGLTTGPEYDELMAEIKRVKQAAAGVDRDLQSRRTREAELTLRLQQEEKRLGDLDSQLDGLMDDLNRQAASGR